jgi:hypothetical protein
MKHEIIYIDDCALIVSELTSPGKEGQVFLSKENIIHTVVGWNYGDRLIIGHRPFTDAAILEGVPLLPEFNKQDDVEELAKDVFPYSIVVGNPAKQIRMRFSYVEVAELLRIKWWDWPEERINAAAPMLQSGNIKEFIALCT